MRVICAIFWLTYYFLFVSGFHSIAVCLLRAGVQAPVGCVPAHCCLLAARHPVPQSCLPRPQQQACCATHTLSGGGPLGGGRGWLELNRLSVGCGFLKCGWLVGWLRMPAPLVALYVLRRACCPAMRLSFLRVSRFHSTSRFRRRLLPFHVLAAVGPCSAACLFFPYFPTGDTRLQ